jgi:hypothetical protein
MTTKYQIVKKINNNTSDPIILHPPTIGDGIYEFDTIDECQNKINQMMDYSIYSNITLTITEVYYD